MATHQKIIYFCVLKQTIFSKITISMKKITALLSFLLLVVGLVQAQDVYFAGNSNGIGKIWKNNTLVYSITDSTLVELHTMQLAQDGSVLSTGMVHDSAFDNVRGRVWLNDSTLFAAGNNTFIGSLALSGDDWTAAGFGENEWGGTKGLVWQNGQLLHTFNDSLAQNFIYALALDPTTGDIYSGGSVDDSIEQIATVWKNDMVLWQEDYGSGIVDIAHDGTDLYAAGYYLLEGLIDAILWKNDSIIFNISGMDNETRFDALALYEGSVYLAGYLNDSLVVWQDGEPIYGHVYSNNAEMKALVVNEFGVYYAGVIDGTVTVWKDGEMLYEVDDCEDIVALAVAPTVEPTYTLTVVADSTDWGFVTGGGTYHYGDTVTIEAIPTTGHSFLFWGDGIITNPRDIVITQDTTFVAHFGLQQYIIQTEVIPEGAGIVNGGGPWAYLYGDTITLEAIPNGGYAFERWDDNVTDNPRTILVTQDSTFTAMFVEKHYTITVESDHPGWGNVTGGGVFNYGDTIQISATPYLGFAFAGWTDGVYTNPRTVIVTDDATYTAHFEVRQCMISTNVTPEGAGTVNGGGTYNYGETIHLTAHSNTGYVFDIWDDGEITNPRSVFVESDATYTAVFTPLTYEITTSSDPENGGSVTGGGTYNYGSTATLTATANEGYMFICWHDGIVTNPRNITVTGNATYKALFHQNGTPTYTITVVSSNPLLGSVTGSGEYPAGTTVEISARPSMNAVFTGWDDGNTDNPRTIEVNGNATYTANFTVAQNYTITVESDNPLGGTVYGSGSYAVGTTVNIGAMANSGYHFTGWQDGNMDNPRTIVVTGDATYTASFAQTPVQSYTVTVFYDDTQGYVLGTGIYVAGSTATLVAIPNDEYRFSKWSDGSTDNRKEIIVDQDIILAAFFEGTGVDENETDNIVLYPNPANDIIRIEGLKGQNEVKIYNAYGLLVKTMTIEDDAEISIADLASGIYFIQFGGSHSLKFVKR